ncbi:MAG: hypothetical protein R8F63_11830 [Acidimicrobiales bacterium]|nr:hypothetical protein [Acidimicrobiales bacterium]
MTRGIPRVSFRDVGDLDNAIKRALSAFPADIDLVAGIPRSGLLAANLFALHRGVPLADLDGLLEGRVLGTGARLDHTADTDIIESARRILVFDDSVFSGSAMAKARTRIDASPLADRVIYGAVFVIPSAAHLVDVACELVPPPRVFSWNLMSHSVLERACVDMDGVLCVDPTPEENDDGPRYREFLRTAAPHMLPGREVQAIVTSRLEKYRPETEAWLAEHGVVYRALHMLDLPDAETRRALNPHAAFKAEIYKQSDAILFAESHPGQAREIARLARKPVVCTDDGSFHQGLIGPARTVRSRLGRVRRRLRKLSPRRWRP